MAIMNTRFKKNIIFTLALGLSLYFNYLELPWWIYLILSAIIIISEWSEKIMKLYKRN